ncbi:hypothetical protein FJZ41_01665 [Candidatus Shapirobacteria bacterium]|nr:hypothetical protein [Candidatus Shapirobacteria bacterium]
MKTLVTHINPDLDAIFSVWMLQRFLLGWEKAKIEFCPAESTFNHQPVDSDPEVLHVDVGLGKLDHHQTSDFTSAAKLSLAYLLKVRKSEQLSPLDKQVLEMMVEVVNEVDNARDLDWPEIEKARYDFYLHNLFWGLRGLNASDTETMAYGLKSLEAIFHILKSRLKAQEEIKQGFVFETPWGQALALVTGNEAVLLEGEKKGYCLVVKKDPQEGGVRIYALPSSKVDLEKAYDWLKKNDSQGEWFLHSSHKILLNESRTKPMKPTKLSLEKIMEILKNG